VKKAENFPPYDLLTANGFLKQQNFGYFPIPDVNAYDTILKGNMFELCQSSDARKLYFHSSCNLTPDISVVVSNGEDGSLAIIMYKSNPNLLNDITPVGVPLVQYQLIEHYVGGRTSVTDHLAKYKSDLKELGFKEINGDAYGKMEKEVGNCIYSWFYQHTDHYLNSNNGYINYNWVITDKNS
jgi:hypothetical protein